MNACASLMRRLRHVNRHTCTGAQTDCECSESQSSPPGLQVPQGLQWGFLGWLPPAADDLLPSPELGSLAALSVPTSPLSSGDIPRRPGRSGVHGRRGAVAKAAVMKTQEAGASCPSSLVPCPKRGSRLCPSQAEDAASAEVPRQDRPPPLRADRAAVAAAEPAAGPWVPCARGRAAWDPGLGRDAVRGAGLRSWGRGGWQGRLAAGRVGQGFCAEKTSRDRGGLFECLACWGACAWEAPISDDLRITQNDRGRGRTDGRQDPESGRRGRAETVRPAPRQPPSCSSRRRRVSVQPTGTRSHHLDRSLLPSPPPERHPA